MEKDNSVELKELKNEALEPEDQVDKSAPKEEHVVLMDNEDDDNESKSSTESSAEETCNKMWEQAFEKLAKADGENDGKIEVKSLVKWIKSLDLNSRVEYEKHLDISPNQIERIVNKVCEIVKNFVKLYLHLYYIPENFFHFDEIFSQLC